MLYEQIGGGGVRARPTGDELAAFVAAAVALDGTFIATSLQVGGVGARELRACLWVRERGSCRITVETKPGVFKTLSTYSHRPWGYKWIGR